MNEDPLRCFWTNPENSADHIRAVLGAYALGNGLAAHQGWDSSSAVLIPIGNCSKLDTQSEPSSAAPCLILNKRSSVVRQPGDLCFPGGGLSPRPDRLIARLLLLPGSPLRRWPFWPQWRRRHRSQSRSLALALAVALREAWEEIHLNPLRVRFIGYLPLHHLIAFNRSIHPMIAEISNADSFKPNWEVERIVRIPLRQLLEKRHYARFRPMISAMNGRSARPLHDGQFPCFVWQDSGGRELLWGATYRMVESFLKIVFRFEVPEMDRLPEISGLLSPSYPMGAELSANDGQ